MSWLALAQTLARRATLAPLEAVINRLLRLDAEAVARLSALSGKAVAVEVAPPGWRVYILPEMDGIRLDTADQPHDALLRGTPSALWRLLNNTGGESLSQGEAELSGDIDVAQRLRAVFTGLEIDWEEELSKVFGDIVAHQLSRGVRSVVAWNRQAAAALTQTFAEYLQEESRLCPRQDEADEFIAEVDTARMDVDRLELRIRRLQARVGAQPSHAV